MERGKVGDRMSMESERVGQSAREGVILEVLDAGENARYRVRWDNGHESTLYPGGGAIRIIPKPKRAAR